MTRSHFSPDVSDLLRLLWRHGVRYLIVGGEAVIHYGYARLTGDVDLYYDAEAHNVQSLYEALSEFWQGEVPGITDPRELLDRGTIFQFGVPPNRIDLLNDIDGVSFDECWANRVETAVEPDVSVRYIGLADLIRNKSACRRDKDLDDLRFLRKVGGREPPGAAPESR